LRANVVQAKNSSDAIFHEIVHQDQTPTLTCQFRVVCPM
jgi:hypothetical protein